MSDGGWACGGKGVCLPLLGPWSGSGSYSWGTWSLHLETTCFKGFINLVLSKKKKGWGGGSGREQPQGAPVGKGNTKEDKRYFVCGMLCRPLFVLKKKAVPCRTSVSASIPLVEAADVEAHV